MKFRLLSCLLASVFAQLAMATACFGEAYIVLDGQPRAQIVIAEKPARTVKLAASELQTYIAKISGATLPIVTARTDDAPIAIYIGRSAYTDRLGVNDEGLKHGAYRMIGGEDHLIFLGNDDDIVIREPYFPGGRLNYATDPSAIAWDAMTGDDKWLFPYSNAFKEHSGVLDIWQKDGRGSINAVYAFLRELGVRWYLPDELGEIVPEMTTIALPQVDRTVRPDSGFRSPYQYGRCFGHAGCTRDEALWQLRLGFNDGPEFVGPEFGLAISHGILNILGRPETMAAHPDWFALYNGDRKTIAPCLSAQGLFEAHLRWARLIYDHYDAPMISAMPTDGYANACACELCAGKSTPERGFDGQISNYVWGYVDRFARELYKTHPDRKVSCFAYSGYLLPPTNIEKLSPNILVGICQTRSVFNDPDQKRKYGPDLRAAWLEKLPEGDKQLLIYDYYLDTRPTGSRASVPIYYPHEIAADLKSLKGVSVGEFIEVYRAPEPTIRTLAANHLNLYVTARLWWDADQDVDALLEEYYTLYYGPARNEMKAFIEYAENNRQFLTRDPAKIHEALGLLVKAQEAAPTESVYARRIGLVTEYSRPLYDLADQLSRGRENVPECRVFYREDAAITLDGKVDEKAWEGVPYLNLREIETGKPPANESAFKVIWSAQDNALYMHIICFEVDPEKIRAATTTNGNGEIFLDDTIELLIETQSHSYYQLVINPAGAMCELDRKNGAINSLWSSGVTVAAHREAGTWSLEVRIPVIAPAQQELDPNGNGVAGTRPTPTFPWYFNVCRQRLRSNGDDFAAYSPTGKKNFHDLQKFAKLFVR